MENSFKEHVQEWREMDQKGRFMEAKQFYFDKLFEEVILNFENSVKSEKQLLESPTDILFSILGSTPEPIILGAKALKPRKHIIFHDKDVLYNNDNIKFLPKFLPEGFERVELNDLSFGAIYECLKQQMAFNAGRSYTINITGGKKSMVAAASIFARDFNSSIIYVDFTEWDSNIRKPIPGTETLNIVYTPIRDLPELFHS